MTGSDCPATNKAPQGPDSLPGDGYGFEESDEGEDHDDNRIVSPKMPSSGGDFYFVFYEADQDSSPLLKVIYGKMLQMETDETVAVLSAELVIRKKHGLFETCDISSEEKAPSRPPGAPLHRHGPGEGTGGHGAYGTRFDEAAQDHAARPRLDVGVTQVAAAFGGLVKALLDHAHPQPRGCEDHALDRRERAAAVRLEERQGRPSVHAKALLREGAVPPASCWSECVRQPHAARLLTASMRQPSSMSWTCIR